MFNLSAVLHTILWIEMTSYVRRKSGESSQVRQGFQSFCHRRGPAASQREPQLFNLERAVGVGHQRAPLSPHLHKTGRIHASLKNAQGYDDMV
jgi:hypothetical protein